MSTATDFPILSLLLFILGFFSIAFGLTAFVVWAIFKEDDILKIYFSARRMHLRDKGVVEIERIDDTKGYVLKHAVCNTRVRVGIPKDGGSVYYCWRCEHVIESFSSGGKGPSGGNDNPVTPPEDTAPIPKDIVEASEKVIQSLKKGSSVKKNDQNLKKSYVNATSFLYSKNIKNLIYYRSKPYGEFLLNKI